MARVLKVPVHVDAIVVSGRSGGRWGADTATEPLTEGTPLEPGVHLQWALPDGLTHGEVGDDDVASYPAVPDLWVVTRLEPPPAGKRRRVTSWVVDAVEETVTPLSPGWTPPVRAAGLPRLTAVGFMNDQGDIVDRDGTVLDPTVPEHRPRMGPLFANYYPDCRRRFGFHDALDGVQRGPLGYLVVGWYANAFTDPLRAAGSAAARREWVEGREWEVVGLEDGWSEAPGPSVIEVPVSEVLETPVRPPRDPRDPRGPRDPSPAGPSRPGGFGGDPIGPLGPFGAGGPVTLAPGVLPDLARTGGLRLSGARTRLMRMAASGTGVAPAALAAGEALAPARLAAADHPAILAAALDVSRVPVASIGIDLIRAAAESLKLPWYVRPGVSDPFPNQLALHGSVVDLRWQGGGGGHGANHVPMPGENDQELVIGSSLAESLAALVGEGDMALFVEAIAHGLTRHLGSVEGLERLPHLLHERAFGSRPSKPKVVWTVELREGAPPPRRPARKAGRVPGGRVAVPVDPRLRVAERVVEIADVPAAVEHLVVRDRRPHRFSQPAAETPSPALLTAAASGRRFTGRVSMAGRRVERMGDLAELAGVAALNGALVDRRLAGALLRDAGRIGGLRGKIRREEIPQPRWWRANAPAVLLTHPSRSYRHGYDGRFHHEGKLVCRAEGSTVTGLIPVSGGQAVRSAAVLEEGAELSRVPSFARELLREAALLDPVGEASLRSAGGADTDAARGWRVESTFWWGVRSQHTKAAQIEEASTYQGRLPSPVAVQPWTPGWAPALLEIDLEYRPTATGLGDAWRLGDIEHELTAEPPVLGAPLSLKLRLLPTPGVVRSLASSIDKLADEAPEGDAAPTQAALAALRTLAARTDGVDALSCSLEGLDRWLREQGHDLRAGALRVLAARTVDVFGQAVSVPGSGVRAANPGEELTVSGHKAVLLPPRIPAWSRLMFRLMAGPGEAPGTEAEPGKSSVCGFLLVDHVEHAVEVFDNEGAALGQLRNVWFDVDGEAIEARRFVWEPAPGREPPVGMQASGTGAAGAIADPDLAGLVQGLLDWNLREDGDVWPDSVADDDRETALSALVRVLDTAHGTVDRVGDTQEYLSTILGRPIAVVRARAELQVRRPSAEDDDPADLPTPAPAGVELRLGSLAQLDDGLVGYYVDRDYAVFHPPREEARTKALASGPGKGALGRAGARASGSPAAIKPVHHPYVEADPTVDLEPGVPRDLLLLVDPAAGVHATCGLLPRKRIALDRDQTEAALAAIAPTFKAGPVLQNAKTWAMPVPRLQGFAWEWTRREGPPSTGAGWSTHAITPADDSAVIPDRPAEVHEGWLRLEQDGD